MNTAQRLIVRRIPAPWPFSALPPFLCRFDPAPGPRTVSGMRQFTAILHPGEPDEGGFWATCLEVPGANGQGETREECLASLRDAVRLLLELERECLARF